MICKINIDCSNIDLDKLLQKFDKYNCEICLSDDCIYVYSDELQQTRQISIILEEDKIRNFFLKEIKEKPTANPQDFVTSWIIERVEQEEKIKIEKANQDNLKQMLSNIDRASEELDNKLKGGAR